MLSHPTPEGFQREHYFEISNELICTLPGGPQDALRRYSTIASLVDREVMAWNNLPEEQQAEMDLVIETLNTLSTTPGAGDVATEAQFVLAVLYQVCQRVWY